MNHKKVVRFVQDHSPYMKGEVASFTNEDADVRSNAGVCELVQEYDKQPDQRVVDIVDENGRLTKIETRIAPDDLQRNVDLPATEAGGEPKDEAHVTDKEKAARAKAMDGAPVNKMAEGPAKKK